MDSPFYGRKSTFGFWSLMIVDFLHGTQRKHRSSSQVWCFRDIFCAIGKKEGCIRDGSSWKCQSYLQITAPILWLRRSRCIRMWKQKVLCGLVFIELNKVIAFLLIWESNWFQKLQRFVNNCSWVASACCCFFFLVGLITILLFSWRGWSCTIKVTRLFFFFPVSGTALQLALN